MSYIEFSKADAIDKGSAPQTPEELAFLFGKFLVIYFENAGLSYQTILDVVAAYEEVKDAFVKGVREEIAPIDKAIEDTTALKLAMGIAAASYEGTFSTRQTLAAIELSKFEFYQRIVNPFQYQKMLQRGDYFPGTEKYAAE